MMEKALLKKLNFIEIYQFFGGVIGVLMSIYLTLSTNAIQYAGPLYIFLILPFLFFGFNIYSAWLLNKKKYLRGLNFVIISLILQIVTFKYSGVYYTSVNGIAVNFTLDVTDDVITGLDFQPSQFIATLSHDSEAIRFKLNLVAFGFLLFISKTLRELKNNLYSII